MISEIDILAIGAHPDDIEIGAGGTLIKHVKMGFKVGLLDLTLGELGTRGDVETRLKEAEVSKDIIGAEFRENLALKDGFIRDDEDSILKLVAIIRQYRPKIILCNAIKDRHPDHGSAANLVNKASFTAGLAKITTNHNGNSQAAFRPNVVYHYIQDRWIDPDFIVDISSEFEDKMKAITSFKSQFYNPESDEPDTPISSKEFLSSIKSKAILWGRTISSTYGEGFTKSRALGVNNILDLK